MTVTELRTLGATLQSNNVFPPEAVADLHRTELGTLIVDITFHENYMYLQKPNVTVLIKDHRSQIIYQGAASYYDDHPYS